MQELTVKCDHCGKQVKDGPVGGYAIVNIEVQPSYAQTNGSVHFDMCRPCLSGLLADAVRHTNPDFIAQTNLLKGLT